MSKVLIVGASGRLGSYISDAIELHGYAEVVRHSRSVTQFGWLKFDPIDQIEVCNALDRVQPDVIINASANTNVDECQHQPEVAYLANAWVPHNLAEWVMQSKPDTYFIQISTDHVYSGSGYQAECDFKIVNNYAYSKLIGELHAARCKRHINIRTNFFGDLSLVGKCSYSDWILGSLREGRPLTLSDKCLFNPVSVNYLTGFVLGILEKPILGTYNLGSWEGMSKFQFANQLAKTFQLPLHLLNRESDHSASSRVVRPLDMRMDVRKVEARIGLVPTLEHMIKELING